MLVDSSKADFEEDNYISTAVNKILTKFKKIINKSEFKELFFYNSIESLVYLMNPERACINELKFDIKDDMSLRNSIKTLNKCEWLDDIVS